MVSLSALLTPWTLFLGALVVVVVAIIVLTVIERRLSKKIVARKEEKQTHFQRELEEIREVMNSPRKFLDKLDATARSFFNEKFGVENGMRYSDLIQEFKKKGNTRAAKFCEQLQEIRYSGDGLDEQVVADLMHAFESFVSDVTLMEEKNEVTKKKEGYWGKEIDLKSVVASDEKTLNSKEEDKDESGLDVAELSRMARDDEVSQRERKESMAKLERTQEENLQEWEDLSREAKESGIQKPGLSEVVPYTKETIPVRKVKRAKRKQLDERIGSIDDLDRVKRKIRTKRNQWAIHGIAID